MYSRKGGKETSLDEGKSTLTKQNTTWVMGASIKEFFLSEKSKCSVDLLPAAPQKNPTAVILLKKHSAILWQSSLQTKPYQTFRKLSRSTFPSAITSLDFKNTHKTAFFSILFKQLPLGTGQGEQQVCFDSGRTRPQKVLQVLIKMSANLLNLAFWKENTLEHP